MWTAVHENSVKPVDVNSEHWQQATLLTGATPLDELVGCLDICARNRSRVAVDGRLRISARCEDEQRRNQRYSDDRHRSNYD